LHSLLDLFPPFLLAVPKKKVSHSRKAMRSANKGLKDKKSTYSLRSRTCLALALRCRRRALSGMRLCQACTPYMSALLLKPEQSMEDEGKGEQRVIFTLTHPVHSLGAATLRSSDPYAGLSFPPQTPCHTICRYRCISLLHIPFAIKPALFLVKSVVQSQGPVLDRLCLDLS